VEASARASLEWTQVFGPRTWRARCIRETPVRGGAAGVSVADRGDEVSASARSVAAERSVHHWEHEVGDALGAVALADRRGAGDTDQVIISRASSSSAPAGYRFPREVIAVAVRWYLR
jgi:hypothetical protein